MTLYDRLTHHARTQPDKTAIECEDGQITYQQLIVLVDHCIVNFESLGLHTGDRVAMLGFNHPDWFICLFAAAHHGVVLVPMNWRLSVDELQYVVQNCGPSVLLHDTQFADTAAKIQSNNSGMRLQAFCSTDFPPEAYAADSQSTLNLKSESHTANALTRPTTNPNTGGSINNDTNSDELRRALLIVYTSGTTGRPKGAVLSQQALMCSAEMSVHMHDMNKTDRVLNVLPLFHVGGLNIQPLPALLIGATLVLPQGFDPQATLNSIANDNISLITVVPTVIKAMMSCPDWLTSDLSSLKAMAIGSTDVPVQIIRNVHKRGIPMLQVYGATETSPVAIYQTRETAKIEGSIGRAGKFCEIRLVNKDGHVVDVDQPGEIQVKGSNILNCYWQDEQGTAAALEDGWFKTGDVAQLDSSGFYWFTDRIKHVIISGGENIYPAELERIISQVAGVDAVSVVGLHDEKWGEVPVGVIATADSSQLNEQSIQQVCSQIAKFKQPREIIFVNELPRNALGKIVVQEVKLLTERFLTDE
jgi:fatty-acyl-CoA synthase